MDNQTSSVPIRLFSQRSILYKIGFFVILLSFLLYIYSFISLNWVYVEDEEGNQFSEGLWSTCHSQCRLLLVIRVMACICVTGYLFTISFGIFDNFRLVSPDYHSRRLEWFALFTGSVGLIMDLIYVLVYFVRLWEASLRMDYTMNFAAILILFVGVTCVACQNRNPRTSRGTIISTPQPMVVQYSQGQPYGFVPPVQANYVPGPNEPLFLQHQHPPHDPPPYSLPPEYPGDYVKA